MVVAQRVKKRPNSLGSPHPHPFRSGDDTGGASPHSVPLGQLSLQFSLYFETAAIRLRLSNFKADARAFFPCWPCLLGRVLSLKKTPTPSRRGIYPTNKGRDFRHKT